MQFENERGIPMASPAVLARLRDLDPAIELRAYRTGAVGYQWAATWQWPENDPRRARIQAGELPPSQAFDIIAWVPLDVSQDEVPSYVERGLVGLGSGLAHVEKMLARIKAENQKAPAERWAKVEDRAMEMFETMAPKASSDVIRMPSAGVPDATPKKGRKRA